MKKILVFATILLILILTNCASNEPPLQDDQFTPTQVGWVLHHYDKNFWNEPDDHNSLKIEWAFTYTGDYYSTLSTLEISDGERAWNYTRDDLEYSSTHIIDLTTKVSNTYYGKGTKDTFRTKTYRFTFTRNNGTTATIDFDLPAPGSLETGGYDFITIDPQLAELPNFAPMLQTASKITAHQSEKGIHVDFTIDSNIAYNGYVAFYNKKGEYIGSSYDFRTNDQLVRETLNRGRTFNTDGTANSVSLRKKDIDFTPGKSFEDIAEVVVILMDGKQYRDSRYDCKSYSATVQVE
ncbi:hypothetical protein [Spirochaeta cellobiosiphila]|uniref:hypothetical protein n=1 Tax=Spirochaeta cellobiosiphila TaxID=504483 RepID=UPI00042584F9|nr:hypothetical protein [Spirochaeta cellobiosiphila]